MAYAAKSNKSLFGKQLGLGRNGQLTQNGNNVNSVCGDCTITLATKAANARAVTIQLLDWAGDNLAVREKVEVGFYLDSTPTDFVATGGSTGFAIGANGKALTIVAKKLFECISDATGKITATYTDTGTEAFAIGVKLPGGRLVMSANFPTG